MWPTTQAPHYAIAILGGSGQANGSGDYFDGDKKETPYWNESCSGWTYRYCQHLRNILQEIGREGWETRTNSRTEEQ